MPDSRIDRPLIFFLAAVLLLVTGIHLTGWQFLLGSPSQRHTMPGAQFDFGVYRYAARMIVDGQGHSLYDMNLQRDYQTRYRGTQYSFFNYPPYSLLPFLPLARLPLPLAFMLWTGVNLALIVGVIAALCRRLGMNQGNWPVLATLAFMPVWAALVNGQLSILTLAGFTWSYALWQDKRRMAGGAALGLAAFKPQLVAGFVCILLLQKRWRELAGFSLVCLPLAVVSVVLVGVGGLLRYPSFIRQAEQPMPGLEPAKMANIRGLMSLFSRVEHPWAVILVSIALLILAAWLWNDSGSGFAIAVCASALVSYHFFPSDLAMAVLPLFLAVPQLPARSAQVLVALALTAPVLLAGWGFAWLALGLLALLVWAAWWTRKTEAQAAGLPRRSQRQAATP